MYYEGQKPVEAKLTNKFDEELSEAREFLNELDEEPIFIMLKDDFPEVYSDWNMVTKMSSKFGYQEDEWSISIIVGNHSGTEIRQAKILKAYNVRTVEMSVLMSADKKILIEDKIKEEYKYFAFECDGDKYLIDNTLNVWKIG